MSALHKVERKNTFQWKIEDFNKSKKHESPYFCIDGYYFSIIADHELYSGSNCDLWQFRLCTSDAALPVSYTISVVDREGHDSVTSKGMVVEHLRIVERTLVILDENYLRNYNIIERDALTVRFTVTPKGLDQPTANSSDVLDCAIQRELSHSSAAKDTSANTASSSDFLDCATQTEVYHSPTPKDTSTNTDEEPAKLLETLSRDFSAFYESRTDADCVLKVDDAQFLVHRFVLSARSPVFSAMFYHDTVENRSGEVNIPDVEATALGDVLYYMYSGKIKGLTTDTAAAMYTVADKYSLIEFREACLDFFKRNLTMENISDAALLAHTHGETELEERVVHFIENRLEELDESEKWKNFIHTKPLLANRLLYTAFKASKQGKFNK